MSPGQARLPTSACRSFAARAIPASERVDERNWTNGPDSPLLLPLQAVRRVLGPYVGVRGP